MSVEISLNVEPPVIDSETIKFIPNVNCSCVIKVDCQISTLSHCHRIFITAHFLQPCLDCPRYKRVPKKNDYRITCAVVYYVRMIPWLWL